ncbi:MULTISPECIES: hypothetical protein [unclassified Microcystis]|jgi:hypothetical protein|uniref:Uncharacterized protein n=2 Tax=Microcystis TaxID=1125 RepID=A0A552KTB4_9CHRO|nr:MULTISPECIES: hypothetical protein [unclassified Microcystis]MCA2628227.1 hypothetical protein [Microcystis sp. M091S2]MCA2772719.1 hypothetical protein [Microcystis sp. M122S2]MCA2787816.1 hypothetical protein [Microcystis sp. M116S2]MCA2818379.1 hypothetical protein [Microcystis sp. M085S1]MCA2856239.1 hypothetical protein [Microcystis sp. M065S1]MCA2879851.1 hypothetical protein [Microcystis sp. M046S1]MCA2907435.1 hypothetical protein [Microcystis sp. M042S1]TRT79888.1 MAG: hypotheti
MGIVLKEGIEVEVIKKMEKWADRELQYAGRSGKIGGKMRTMVRLLTKKHRRPSQKTGIWLATLWGCLCPGLAIAGVPNGTWLSQPQIRFHSSTNTLGQVMKDIQSQNYKVVFLDFRGVSDEVQRRVSREAREYRLMPVVWVQSPQYRSLSVAELIHEARHGDGIQVDDHFFAHYSEREFQSLDYQYRKPIFCSIQPFQANLVTGGRCNQLDVQCYATENFRNCIALAERLDAVVSLSEQDTFRYREQLGARPFNIFLWPYSYLPPTTQNLFHAVFAFLREWGGEGDG